MAMTALLSLGSFARRQSDMLTRRLAGLAPLSGQELSIIRQTAATAYHVPAGTELHAEGEAFRKPGALLSGWACRLRMLADGRRQIFDFLIPGDVFGICTPSSPVATATAVTLTSARIAGVGCLREMVDEPERFAGLARAFAAVRARQDACLLNQVVRLGRQTAYERIAHLLLELGHRLDEVGLEMGSFVPLPLTQEVIGDALGLSVVHVNRTLQQLRRDRLVELRSASMRLLKPDALAAIADYRLPQIDAPALSPQGPTRI